MDLDWEKAKQQIIWSWWPRRPWNGEYICYRYRQLTVLVAEDWHYEY